MSDSREIADRLHSAAIHLLRRVRRADPASGLTPPRLSALSVIVHGGPLSMGALAAAEQVRPPSMSRAVDHLEREGLAMRVPDPDDRRVQRVQATDRGRALLAEARRLRVEGLAERLEGFTARERNLLRQAAGLMERLALPEDHPGSGEEDLRASG
jgi:DNA-binding MarR family transcriptional regulator